MTLAKQSTSVMRISTLNCTLQLQPLFEMMFDWLSCARPVPSWCRIHTNILHLNLIASWAVQHIYTRLHRVVACTRPIIYTPISHLDFANTMNDRDTTLTGARGKETYPGIANPTTSSTTSNPYETTQTLVSAQQLYTSHVLSFR